MKKLDNFVDGLIRVRQLEKEQAKNLSDEGCRRLLSDFFPDKKEKIDKIYKKNDVTKNKRNR